MTLRAPGVPLTLLADGSGALSRRGVRIGDEAENPLDFGVLSCMSLLVVQYFLVYTVLATVRMVSQIRFPEQEAGDDEPPRGEAKLDSLLESTENAVQFAPMLCILFLAVQMQSSHLFGVGERPPRWCRWCMLGATFATFGGLVIVLLLSAVTGESPAVDQDTGVVRAADRPYQSPAIAVVAKLLEALGWVLTLLLYGACGAIIVWILIGTKDGLPVAHLRAPAAICCAVSLTVQCLLVQLLRLGVRLQTACCCPQNPRALHAVRMASQTVFFCPMLSLLFIAARMRALQVDPERGAPQAWAQVAFYVCTYSVLAQTVLALVVPALPGGDMRVISPLTPGVPLSPGLLDFHLACLGRGLGRVVLVLLRYGPMCGIYGGLTTVIVSVLAIQSPTTGQAAAMSPAVSCVVALVLLFFLVYLMLWITVVVRDVKQGLHSQSPGLALTLILQTLSSARATVSFCPMLAILCVSLRMRALKITAGRGAPQPWAQVMMFLCVAAVLLQLVVVFLLPVAVRTPPARGAGFKVDPDGSPDATVLRPGFWAAAIGVRVLSFLALYGGAGALCAALFLITPETARMRESEMLPVQFP